ncbi:MAG: nuclear transport factor 2 family protein [Ktedonobacterales bacterium]
MDTTEVIDLIEQQIAAFNARDIEGFVDCYAADARIIDASGTVMAEGHNGLRQMYAPLFDNSPELQAKITNRIQIGSWVIDDEYTTAFVLPGYPTELRAVVVYHVVDGKIAQSQLLG